MYCMCGFLLAPCPLSCLFSILVSSLLCVCVCVCVCACVRVSSHHLTNLYDLQTLRTTLDAIYDAKVPPLWGKVSQTANKNMCMHAIVIVLT